MSNLLLYTANESKPQIQLRARNKTVWMSQWEMAKVFGMSPENVRLHLEKIYEDGELSREATIEESSVVGEACGASS